MTVSGTNSTVSQVADGLQNVFVYDFLIAQNEDLAVFLAGIVQTTGFVVAGEGNPLGGTVTFDVPPTVGESPVALVRDTPLLQLVDYLPFDPFPAETHEDALDKLTLIAQETRNTFNVNSVRAPVDEVNASMILPSAALRGGKLQSFEVNGDVTVIDADSLSIADLSAFQDWRADLFSGTGAQVIFVLSASPGLQINTQIFVDGVYQQKDTYTLAGSTITFSEAPPLGTDNIEVVYGKARATVDLVGPFQAGNGSLGLPSYSFLSNTITGMFLVASGQIGLSLNNDLGILFANPGIRVKDGSAGGPSFTFIGDSDTGFYSLTTNEIGWANAGGAGGSLTGSGVRTVTGNATFPAFTFLTDPRTGMFSGGVDILGFAATSTELLRMSVANGLMASGALRIDTVPDIKLTLAGSASPRIVFESTGFDDFSIDVVAGLRFRNSTQARDDMIFDANGHVGIGSAANATAQFILQQVGAAATRLFLLDPTGVNFSEFFANATTARLQTRGSQDLTFGTNDVERMRLMQTTGRLGINVTNPAHLLQVTDLSAGVNETLALEFGIANADGAQLSFRTQALTTGGIQQIRSGAGVFIISFQNWDGASLVERMNIDNAGRVTMLQGVSMTNLPTSNPGGSGLLWSNSNVLNVT